MNTDEQNIIDLRGKADALKIQLSDTSQGLRFLYDELRGVSASDVKATLEDQKEKLEDKIKFLGMQLHEINKKLQTVHM